MMKDHMNVVEAVLKAHPETRDDDMKLYVWIISEICPEVMKQPFAKVLWYHNNHGLPSYESVTRARRKLQEKNPELRGKKYEKRMMNQDEYIKRYGRRYS